MVDRYESNVLTGVSLRPDSGRELVRVQEALAELRPPLWRAGSGELSVAGCFVAFPRGLSGRGSVGDRSVAAAVVLRGALLASTAVVRGVAGAPYRPGMLFLRSGTLLAAAVRALAERPDVLMVNGTGRDHPRGAGLALHLGALLDIPSVGVTHRPLCAEGPPPDGETGSMSPFGLGGEVVGYWLRTRRGARPLAVHAAWRTTPKTAAAVALSAVKRARTPEPLRMARQAARNAR